MNKWTTEDKNQNYSMKWILTVNEGGIEELITHRLPMCDLIKVAITLQRSFLYIVRFVSGVLLIMHKGG